MCHAETLLLTEAIRKIRLDRALSRALEPWRPRLAVHDPAKVLLDLTLGLAVGGDCMADVALLRAEPAVFGPVASDPTVSRMIDRRAIDGPAILTAIDTVRAAAWEARRGADAQEGPTGVDQDSASGRKIRAGAAAQ